jgi:hypothetical protein
MTAKPRFLGVTVLGDFLLSEGPQAVLENLLRIGVTAVATNPTVTAPAPDGQGSFQPPSDAGSSPRVFDRPLFGRHSLWVRGAPSYRPDPQFYKDSPYAPRRPNDLTDEHGHVIGDFIRLAAGHGLKVYLQVGAAQPSGLRDEDRPRLPDGTVPPNRMADTASLASEAVRAYNRAYVRDLTAAYPEVTGFRPDWPEYPCYTLGEVFQDFSPHVEQWCRAKDPEVDFATVRRLFAGLYAHLLSGDLTNQEIDLSRVLPQVEFQLEPKPDLRVISDPLSDEWHAAASAWLGMKMELSSDILRHWRVVLTEAGGERLELSANAFMPKYHSFTGFNFSFNAEHCDAVSPKLYTMHWSQMVEFWGRPLLEANPSLDERMLTKTLLRLMGLDDETAGRTLADYGYPGPDEPHPISDALQAHKIQQVIAYVGGRCAVTPLVHGYGPAGDFERRLRVVAESEADGVWINRYGYLSDEKLAAIARVWSGR